MVGLVYLPLSFSLFFSSLPRCFSLLFTPSICLSTSPLLFRFLRTRVRRERHGNTPVFTLARWHGLSPVTIPGPSFTPFRNGRSPKLVPMTQNSLHAFVNVIRCALGRALGSGSAGVIEFVSLAYKNRLYGTLAV